MNAISGAPLAQPSRSMSAAAVIDLETALRVIPGTPTPLTCRIVATTFGALAGVTCEDNSSIVNIEEELDTYALTLPVTDVDDVSALLTIASVAVELLEDNVPNQKEVDKQTAVLRRVLAKVLPFLLRQGCVNSGEIGCYRFLEISGHRETSS